eukprot:4842662-Amphidinium_carterae.1
MLRLAQKLCWCKYLQRSACKRMRPEESSVQGIWRASHAIAPFINFPPLHPLAFRGDFSCFT